MSKKCPDSYYIPYLQANTNTNASLEKLKETYEPLLRLNNVVGLAIATRPDCISDEVLEIKAGERVAQGAFFNFLVADNGNTDEVRKGGFGPTN